MFAAGDETATSKDAEVAAAVRACPLAVEPLTDGVVHGFTGPVDAEFQHRTAFDAHRRQPAVTGLVEHSRVPGKREAVVAAETADAVRSHERPAAVRTITDWLSGFRRGNAVERVLVVTDYFERAITVGGRQEEAIFVARAANRLGTGEPRRRLIAAGVVHEHGIVGFHERDHRSARASFVVSVAVRRRALSCEEKRRIFGHSQGWSRYLS